MTNVTLKTVAVLGLVSMAACGGGGGSSPSNPTTPPTPVDNGPASTSSADLLDYVIDGGEVVGHQYADQNDITRMQRSTTVDGEQVTVTLDQLPDGTNGVIKYVRGDDVALYKLDDDLAPSTEVPEGDFVGTFDASYSVDGGETWNVGSGDGGVSIDTVTGEAHFGGMATDSSVDGLESTSIEYYSTADLVDGRFVDNGADVVYREDGFTVDTYTGTVDGMYLGDDTGVVGTVSGDDGPFRAAGGFTYSPYSE